MPDQNHIIIKGLCQNNLKNISLKIPKEKLVVFTGVSGSGKSSIVFDTIAAESQRQMNETYSAYVRGRLPKYEKPKAERIENLSPSVIIDQNPLGGNARSTVGTISDMYSALRLLPGSPAAFLGSWLLTLVSTLSIGMIVGGIAKNEKMASVIACLLYFPMLVFSGAALPFEVMPETMQKMVALFPLTQGIQLMKAASLGIHTEAVWMPAAVMGTVTILCTGVAVKCFKWE